jgi:hypothetical protein
MTVRRFRENDAGVLWALNVLPNKPYLGSPHWITAAEQAELNRVRQALQLVGRGDAHVARTRHS